MYIIGGGHPKYDNYKCPKMDTILEFTQPSDEVNIVANISIARDVAGTCINGKYIYIISGRDS